MKSFKIENTNDFVYSDELDNGLNVYLIPNSKFNNIYATFTTKFGGKDLLRFGGSGNNAYPAGIAHFLEHKMFDQENDQDIFEAFSKSGTSVNAYTSLDETTYLFKGRYNFEENLNLLMNFVQEPYFEKNKIIKEQEIIVEENHMYLDDPNSVLFNTLLKNTFVEDHVREGIIGNDESIRSIESDMLYECYHTYYHPSNMILVISGNIDPKETLEFIKANQEKKIFMPIEESFKPVLNEPENVLKKYEELSMPILIPKIAITFKIKLADIEADNNFIKFLLVDSIFTNKFGKMSDFSQDMVNRNLIFSSILIEEVIINDYIIVALEFESENYEEALKEVFLNLSSFSMTRNDLIRFKKQYKSSVIKDINIIYNLNRIVTNDILDCGSFIGNKLELIDNVTLNDLDSAYSSIKFKNYSVVVIKPKAK